MTLDFSPAKQNFCLFCAFDYWKTKVGATAGLLSAYSAVCFKSCKKSPFVPDEMQLAPRAEHNALIIPHTGLIKVVRLSWILGYSLYVGVTQTFITAGKFHVRFIWLS